MDIPIIYIGFAQAVFIALIIFLKKPLKIADVILGFWMLAIASMFGLNIGREINEVTVDTWMFSLTISITYPAFLYLYAKYVTVDFKRFQGKDTLHGLPFIISIILIYLFRNTENEDFYFDLAYYEQLSWLRNIIGTFYILALWVYGVLAIKIILNFRKQIKDQYSFESDRISLTWLLLVVVSFIVANNIIIIASTLEETNVVTGDIDNIRDIALLIYVYLVGIWGYRQNQLSSDAKSMREISKNFKESKSDTGKYQKSGLKEDQATGYVQRLINFMDQSEEWKDKELSVAKLSVLTNIPKHHITQVLNENLQKNFYVFVNEFRIEQAKKMIKSQEYNSWSLVAVADECGFNSKTAFNNFFKKSTGMTPSEFRQKLD